MGHFFSASISSLLAGFAIGEPRNSKEPILHHLFLPPSREGGREGKQNPFASILSLI
jgi:hypothetical protein